MKTGVCDICGKAIHRVRTPEGFPRFAWKSEQGFYCVNSHDSWHYPAAPPVAPPEKEVKK